MHVLRLVIHLSKLIPMRCCVCIDHWRVSLDWVRPCDLHMFERRTLSCIFTWTWTEKRDRESKLVYIYIQIYISIRDIRLRLPWGGYCEWKWGEYQYSKIYKWKNRRIKQNTRPAPPCSLRYPLHTIHNHPSIPPSLHRHHQPISDQSNTAILRCESHITPLISDRFWCELIQTDLPYYFDDSIVRKRKKKKE